MKILFTVIALAGLLLVVIPPVMHFAGGMEADAMKDLMFIGTMVWFAGAIPLLGRKKKTEAQDSQY